MKKYLLLSAFFALGFSLQAQVLIGQKATADTLKDVTGNYFMFGAAASGKPLFRAGGGKTIDLTPPRKVVVSPLDYGAIAGDLIDDAAAFQLAADAARGGILDIPEGRFLKSTATALDPAYPITIQGQGINAYQSTDGNGTSIIQTTATSAFTILNPANAVEALHKIEIRNLGLFSADVGLYGIKADYIHGLVLEDIWVAGFTKDGIMLTDCWSSKINRVVSAHNLEHGLHLFRRNNNVTVSNSTFNANSRKNGFSNLRIGGAVGAENLNVNITGCDFSYAGQSPVETITAAYNLTIADSWSVNITGCYSEGGKAIAYIGSGTQAISVTGNYFQDRSFTFDGTQNSVFAHNTYQKIAADGLLATAYLSGITDGVNVNRVYSNYPRADVLTAQAVKFIGTSATPSLIVAAGAGTGATASVVGNDTGGVVTINTGTATAAGSLVRVTFAQAYAVTPVIVLSGAKGTGATAYTNGEFPDFFSIILPNTPAASASYHFAYIVVGRVTGP